MSQQSSLTQSAHSVRQVLMAYSRHRMADRDAAREEFDVVMAWSVDRLGRSLQDLVSFLSELHALKIDLFLRQQGLDTTTPAGKALFQMMGVFAEFEWAMIAERVRAGLARARGEGKRLGRRPLPQHWKNESARPWRFLGGPVCAPLLSNSESIPDSAAHQPPSRRSRALCRWARKPACPQRVPFY